MTGLVVRDMAPCPRCGVLLDARLVAAIRDPRAEETCPRGPRSVPVEAPVMQTIPVRRIGDLSVLMILGAQMRAVHESGFEDDEEMPEAA